MRERLEAEVTVSLCADDSTGISLSATDRPVEVLRKAASLLERYAASIEREQEPIACAACGTAPTGVRASPAGEWRFEPCGHGIQEAARPS
jgi:hypothetical protein